MTTRNLSARKVRAHQGKEGRRLSRVSVPWLGMAWMLDEAQRDAVRQLLEARLGRDPDVILPDAKRLFAGTGLLGVLVVPGCRPGAWRMAVPPPVTSRGPCRGASPAVPPR
jgi:hypothetical protein